MLTLSKKIFTKDFFWTNKFLYLFACPPWNNLGEYVVSCLMFPSNVSFYAKCLCIMLMISNPWQVVLLCAWRRVSCRWKYLAPLTYFWKINFLRKRKIVFNSVLNFWRVKHFWLCLLETQVSYMWMPFLNKYMFCLRDFYNGEIGCPTLKRFYSPSTKINFVF